jgi:hypothetical protein
MMIVDYALDRPIAGISGKRVFVVGSGPSLDRTDLGLLRNRPILALNAAYSLFTSRKDYPDAWWVVRDRRAIGQVLPRLEAEGVKVITTLSCLDEISGRARKPLRTVHAYVFGEKRILHDRTIATDALQIARVAGASDALLVGVDCHAPPGQPYAEKLSWKPCAWYDRDKPVTESKACASMLEAMRRLASGGKLGSFPVFSASATCDAFPFLEYAVAVSGEHAPTV